MIDARELRIGNLIEPITKSPCLVTGITFQKVKDGELALIFADNESFLPEHISPIELSEEIMSKTYFHRKALNDDVNTEMRKTAQGNWFAIIHCSAATHLYVWHTGQIDINGVHVIHVNTKYFHRIQNLFYALTGTDLELHPQKP